jgi:hypothetical protein
MKNVLTRCYTFCRRWLSMVDPRGFRHTRSSLCTLENYSPAPDEGSSDEML